MDGANIIVGISTVDFLPSESFSFPLGLHSGHSLFLLGALGLPDATSTVKAVYDLAFPQVLAFSSACLGVIVIVYFVKAFRS